MAVPGTGNTAPILCGSFANDHRGKLCLGNVVLFGRLVCSYHRGNITSEVADFKGILSDSDGDIIALKWTKDPDQICFWGIGGSICYVCGPTARASGCGGGQARRLLGCSQGHSEGAFIANFPRCSLQEESLNGRAGRNCGRSCCAANENFMQSLWPWLPREMAGARATRSSV